MVPVKLLAVLSLAVHGAYGGIADLDGLADQGGLEPLTRGDLNLRPKMMAQWTPRERIAFPWEETKSVLKCLGNAVIDAIPCSSLFERSELKKSKQKKGGSKLEAAIELVNCIVKEFRIR